MTELTLDDAPLKPSPTAREASRSAHGDRSGSTERLERSAEAAELEVEQLTRALQSRAGIDQAKGVLMAVYGISADDAFQALVTVSQSANIKLTTVASCFLARAQDVDFGVATRDELFALLRGAHQTDAPSQAEASTP